MKILGFDTETTGLDPEKDRITEMGLVLYDTASAQPVRISGFLVKTGGMIISPELEKLTGITNAAVNEFGVEPTAALRAMHALTPFCDYLMAHNAEFDRGFYEAECRRQQVAPCARPWIDTRTDLPKDAYQLGKSASLKYLACDHGFVYPAHRAVNDVLAMLEIFGRYDLDTIIRRATTPNVNVRAVVSFEDRSLAKERGYYWRPETKLWVKPLKADEVDLEKELAPFPVVLMEGK